MQTLEGKLSNKEIAEFLRNASRAMLRTIESKSNSAISRQRPTHRRMRIAGSMMEEAERLIQIQRILEALAKAHETNNIVRFPFLEDIRNRKQIELLRRYNRLKELNHNIPNWLKNEQATFDRLSIYTESDWKQAFYQLSDLMREFGDGKRDEDSESVNKKRIRELEMDILSRKIPGFFPTPKPLIERMIEMAQIKSGDDILDPSAGKGDIIEVVKEKFGNKVSVGAIEINSTLLEILQLKGYPIHGTDFFQFSGHTYDCILMNPPFENAQDIDHVNFAYHLLNNGGRIVAVMSEGTFFRQGKKETEFRGWLHEAGAIISEPIKEAFKGGFKSTGVTVRLVMLEKKNSARSAIKKEPEEVNDEDLLELEAQAELELLKMRVESLKRKNLSGDTNEYSNHDKIVVVDESKTLKNIPEIKLTYNTNTGHEPIIANSGKASADFIKTIYEENTIEMQEQFVILFLNRSLRILGYSKMFKGGITGTVADLRMIFATALKSLSTGIILAHNHPSGNLRPSDADIQLTRNIKDVGKLMTIDLVDHIILTKDGFFSFAEEGIL